MRKILWLPVLLLVLFEPAWAGQVEVRHARLERQSDGRWDIQVTLRHADSGWQHYADAWRVVTVAGKALATRTLFHPHVDEQPFTRGLSGVRVPEGVQRLRIEAHDKVHGWSPHSLDVDLTRSSGSSFEVLGTPLIRPVEAPAE